jgi:FKBP-type peptidyl-prolyl cis-trans isomerase FkpA/FKBP-type peptidyl-prolyl cis-trans isomerase FklB
MRRFAIPLIVVLCLIGCASAETAQAPELETEEQKTLYALGFAVSNSFQGAYFEASELELIQRGLADGLLGQEAAVEMSEYGPKVNALMGERVTLAATKEKEAGQAYCDEAAAAEGAVKTASGAIYLELEKGEGPQPGPTDQVKLHYHGTLRDGTVFDSSVEKGEPSTFRVNGVVPCFSEGVQQMHVGGKAKLVCPSDTAYGDRGRPPLIKPGAALTFEVELLEIVAAD